MCARHETGALVRIFAYGLAVLGAIAVPAALPGEVQSLTFGKTTVGSASTEGGLMILGGTASTVEPGRVDGLLGLAGSSDVFLWGRQSDFERGYVTRFDPLLGSRIESFIFKNFTPNAAAMDEERNRIVFLHTRTVPSVLTVDIGTLEEIDRSRLPILSGTLVNSFPDSASGTLWFIQEEESSFSMVEFDLETLDYGRIIPTSLDLTHVRGVIPGEPGVHYIVGSTDPGVIHRFDALAGEFGFSVVMEEGEILSRHGVLAPDLDRLLVASLQTGTRLHTFDPATLERKEEFPIPISYAAGLYRRGADGLVYSAGWDIPTRMIAVDPSSGQIVKNELSGHDLEQFGILQEILYDPIHDVTTFVTSDQVLGSITGGEVRLVPSAPTSSSSFGGVYPDAQRGRIWVTNEVTREVRRFDSETVTQTGLVQLPSSGGSISAAYLDEATGNLYLGVISDQRRIVVIDGESAEVADVATIPNLGPSASIIHDIAVTTNGDVYALVGSAPSSILRFPAGSPTHNAITALNGHSREDVMAFGVDESLGLLHAVADTGTYSDPNHRMYLFNASDLIEGNSYDLGDQVGDVFLSVYHPGLNEMLLLSSGNGEGGAIAAASIESSDIRIVCPLEDPHIPAEADVDPHTGRVHLLRRGPSSVRHWIELDIEAARLKTRGYLYFEELTHAKILEAGMNPRVVALNAGFIRILDSSRLTLHPVDVPPLRMLEASQVYASTTGTSARIARVNRASGSRHPLTPTYIEQIDWRTQKVSHDRSYLVTGAVDSILEHPTEPNSVMIMANAQSIEVTIYDEATKTESVWSCIDSNYGRGAWMNYDPLGNHLVVGTTVSGGGGFLVVLDADTLEVVADHQLTTEDGSPLTGVIDEATGDVIVALDKTLAQIARFSIPALEPIGESISLEGYGRPAIRGMIADSTGRRVYAALRGSGTLIAVDLESFGVVASSRSYPFDTAALSPISGFVYELAIAPSRNRGYLVGSIIYDSVTVHEFRLDDLARLRLARVSIPSWSSLVGKYGMAYDADEDVLVIGGASYVHATFRDLLNMSNITIPQKVVAESINFYSHEATGSLRFGIYETDLPGNRIWDSGVVENTSSNDFLTVPILTSEGDPLILEPDTYVLTWRSDSAGQVASFERFPIAFQPIFGQNARATPFPFEAEGEKLPVPFSSVPTPSSTLGYWTFYLEATPVDEPLTGWAVY